MATPVQVCLTALELAQAGRFAEVRELFAPALRVLVVPEALRSAWEAELLRQGSVTSVGDPVTEAAPGGLTVKVPVLCERGGFTLVGSVSDEGYLAGLQLAASGAAEPAAPWSPPAYADPTAFEEQDVTLDPGALAVAGTMTVPTAAGPLPGVVLLAGSGALDRDETIGRNKPFRDIAWGLATAGVAVLRFDKVTFAHAGELKGKHDFTLSDEYLPQAVAAMGMLRRHQNVDPERIFLLGHSLGGSVAPRVAKAEPSTAGLIILAGSTQPLQWTIVRQARHLAALRPDAEAASRPVIEALIEQAKQVDSAELSPATPADRLPLGAPAAYWLDLRGYRPAEVAATLHKPMLILQGGRDYQVTVDDDLAGWRAALDGRADVTIRVYPDHNHLFTPGQGPSSPAEYEPAQHVDGAVIADIASWISDQPAHHPGDR